MLFAAALFAGVTAQALQPSEMLADPVLENRARDISRDLRCVVCQNQSIDDSDADLARDLRVLVRERLVAGDTDREVIDYVVSRYGDFVLLRPPFRPDTYLLWFGPLLVLAMGGTAIALWIRRRQSAAGTVRAVETAPLTPDEEERLAAVLNDQALGGAPVKEPRR
ncbi:MAG: cytochrome c-type biogenesis protein CcmH [Rhodospirillales bacterium]|nr:cytochrome c-type biogenesis protein CcmH [Rhodospirillales bacterium]